jgi:hypothetical protein
VTGPASTGPHESLTRELSRVSDRLRSLSVGRLTRPDAEGSAPAVRAHRAAQALADLAADATGRAHRPVPVLEPHAAADQVLVTGRDVLAEGDAPAVAAALDVLVGLRRAL